MFRTIGMTTAAAVLMSAHLACADEGGSRDWLKMRSINGLPMTGARLDLDRAANRRYAVVVGNDTYQHASSLENAGADARAMAKMLREQGFQVLERYNLDKRGFEDLMRELLFEAYMRTQY